MLTFKNLVFANNSGWHLVLTEAFSCVIEFLFIFTNLSTEYFLASHVTQNLLQQRSCKICFFTNAEQVGFTDL